MMNKLVGIFYRPDPDPAYPHWSDRDPDLVQNVPDPLTLHAVNPHGMFTRAHFLAHTTVQCPRCRGVFFTQAVLKSANVPWIYVAYHFCCALCHFFSSLQKIAQKSRGALKNARFSPDKICCGPTSAQFWWDCPSKSPVKVSIHVRISRCRPVVCIEFVLLWATRTSLTQRKWKNHFISTP